MTKSKGSEMRIIVAIAFVASLLAGCGAGPTPGKWGGKTFEDAITNGSSGG
jgi:hypothetical protein